MDDVVEMHVRVDRSDVRVVGRDAWALSRLLHAGEKGCTPIEQPASRCSHYVFKLRRAVVVVKSITENHSGAYAGHHARYVLVSKVDVISVIRTGKDRHAA